MTEKSGQNNLLVGLLLLIAFALLVLLGLAADLRRSLDRFNVDNKNGIESLRHDFTRYLTTGECGQFVDNKNQLQGAADGLNK